MAIFILVVTLMMLIRLIYGTKRKLISFEESKIAIKESFESQRARNIPDVPRWFINVFYVLYIAYYVIACMYFRYTWFTILSAFQILLTISESFITHSRFVRRDDIDSWKKQVHDTFLYKLICNVILDYIYYIVVIILSIIHIFF